MRQHEEGFTSHKRKTLFLELAGRPDGASVAEVYRVAQERGDTVSEEAYYNLVRRLQHRGLVQPIHGGHGTRYKLGAYSDSDWLEEDDLSALVDPEYPLLALTIWRESRRQINQMPEEIWAELRERLMGQDARSLFGRAILSYASDFESQISFLLECERNPPLDLPRIRQEAETSRQLLVRLTKFGLGLSREAVDLPSSIDAAMSQMKADPKWHVVAEVTLEEELARRIESGPFVVAVSRPHLEAPLVIGAVDGSTRAGILSFMAEEGDFGIGHAPMIAINTSIGQVDRQLRVGGRSLPVFLRLPEKPEDMQRADNRYTVMAKLLYPDLSDAEYMHAVWNAMDLLEAKAADRLLHRWYRPSPDVEVPPADVVLRDGTVSPQDRDFSHYSAMSTYGRIVRDMIEVNWRIASKCQVDGQTVAGVVKAAQLTVFAPVLNWFACQVAKDGNSQLASWPLHSMNLMPDQVILTRLLTAGRKRNDPWLRTCLVLRPFHAVSNFAHNYSRQTRAPSRPIMNLYKRAKDQSAELEQDRRQFWETFFRGEADPFVKMLDNIFYGSTFLGAFPRLDAEKTLPRLEFLVPAPTEERAGDPLPIATAHANRLFDALKQTGFEVSNEHSMFGSDAKIDVLPSLVIRAHDTVKHWAAELLSRVQEYIGYFLASYVNKKKFRGVKIRPFTRQELELLYSQLRQERELQAGAPGPSGTKPDLLGK